MSATFDTAKNEILTFFQDAWDTTGFTVVYENNKFEKPPTQVPWARASLRHTTGRQSSLSGGLGTSRFDRSGIFTVQIFIPNGEGLSQGYTLGKVVADAFEGKTTASQVWFRDISMNEVGPSDEWFQFNLTIGFMYDEIK